MTRRATPILTEQRRQQEPNQQKVEDIGHDKESDKGFLDKRGECEAKRTAARKRGEQRIVGHVREETPREKKKRAGHAREENRRVCSRTGEERTKSERERERETQRHQLTECMS